MEIKKNRKNTKSFYVPLLTALLVIAAAVAVAFPGRSPKDEKQDETTAAKSSVEAVLPAAREVEDKSDEDDLVPPRKADLHAPEVTQAEPETEPEPETEDVSAEAAPPAVPTFISPVSGVVSKAFSADVPVFSETMNDYRVHTGVDVTAGAGEAVLASAPGVIGAIWDDPLMGKCMTVVHEAGYVSTYKGLYETLPEGIAQGTKVEAGQPIAAVGESALIEIAEEPHVHFELTKDGVNVDPCTLVTFSGTESFEG